MARGDGVGDGSGKGGADCVVSRVLCLVSSCLFERKEKRGAGRVNGNSQGKVQTLAKDWPSQAYSGIREMSGSF